MIVKRYGIELKTLEEKHLEELRVWRNRDRHFMEYTEEIDAVSQQKWFANLDHRSNLLFTYHFEGKVHGFLQVKEIDFQRKIGEAGVIHGEKMSLESSIPILAIIVLMEIAFDMFGLDSMRAKIKRGNQQVVHMNEKLGYQILANQDNVEHPYYHVTKNGFANNTRAFRKMLEHRHGANTVVSEKGGLEDLIQPPSHYEFIDPARIIATS